MNVERFVVERQPDWDELRGLVASARGRPERLAPNSLRRLGSLYRSAVADLSYVRRRYARDPIVAQLDRLVASARTLVYDAKPRRGGFVAFIVTGYWQRVAERGSAVGLSAALLFVPWVLAMAWAAADPDSAARVVPGALQSVTRDDLGTDGMPADARAAFASFVLTNNIRVTFLAFAAGIVVGLGTAWVLAFNGIVLGTVSGLAVSAGNGATFGSLVFAHGVLELSCIVVAGAAGLRLGWSLVDPGELSRGNALRAEARRSVEIVLGTMPWLVLAGLIEGFLTPSNIGAGPALLVGASVASVYWVLLVWRGAGVKAGRGPSPAGTPRHTQR